MFLIILAMSCISIMALIPSVAVAATQGLPTCEESQPTPSDWFVIPSSGPVGTTIYIQGGLGIPDGDILVYYRDTGELVYYYPHENILDYKFRVYSVPEGTPVGVYDIVVLDHRDEVSYCFTFTVTPTPVVQNAYAGVTTTTPSTATPAATSLPSTGAFLLPAAGLLIAGAGALVARRRK
jgi:LPXTG-motif cell wall-anchored protein